MNGCESHCVLFQAPLRKGTFESAFLLNIYKFWFDRIIYWIYLWMDDNLNFSWQTNFCFYLFDIWPRVNFAIPVSFLWTSCFDDSFGIFPIVSASQCLSLSLSLEQRKSTLPLLLLHILVVSICNVWASFSLIIFFFRLFHLKVCFRLQIGSFSHQCAIRETTQCHWKGFWRGEGALRSKQRH